MIHRIDIKPEMLAWAIERAGHDMAVYLGQHPDVDAWYRQEKQPTVRQLETFANQVRVPFGYLFLDHTPQESVPFPVFRGEAGQKEGFDLDVFDTVNSVRLRQEWLSDYLVNNVAPYIFVNSQDAKRAQLFTLVHEAAHIMLGVSAGHAETDTLSHDATERYCDMVAAEFLVPAMVLREVWGDGDLKRLSRRFWVSELVIARRAHNIGMMSDRAYRAFWQEYSHRPHTPRSKRDGGDFYRSSLKRVGKLFAIHVRNAVNSSQLSYTEAYRLTGLKGHTYDVFTLMPTS